MCGDDGARACVCVCGAFRSSRVTWQLDQRHQRANGRWLAALADVTQELLNGDHDVGEGVVVGECTRFGDMSSTFCLCKSLLLVLVVLGGEGQPLLQCVALLEVQQTRGRLQTGVLVAVL